MANNLENSEQIKTNSQFKHMSELSGNDVTI